MSDHVRARQRAEGALWSKFSGLTEQALARDVIALLEEVETAERRLRHSEFHRTHHRRAMRRRGKTIEVLSAKIVRLRTALREQQGGKRLSQMERASDMHHSLRTGP